jgi:hypothetical protein
VKEGQNTLSFSIKNNADVSKEISMHIEDVATKEKLLVKSDENVVNEQVVLPAASGSVFSVDVENVSANIAVHIIRLSGGGGMSMSQRSSSLSGNRNNQENQVEITLT